MIDAVGVPEITGGLLPDAAAETVSENAVRLVVAVPSLTEIRMPDVVPTSVDDGVPDKRPVEVENVAQDGRP